jgi:hypothetical protein
MIPAIEPHEGELSYLLRLVAADSLAIEVRQKAANKAVKILRKNERNYPAENVWKLAKIVQPGSRYAPGRRPAGYVPNPE